MGEDLIFTSLEALRRRLDIAFQNADRRAEDWVVLSNLVDQAGQPAEGARDRILMSLVNIAQDSTLPATWAATPSRSGDFLRTAPPLHVELTLLFTANFAGPGYAQGLRMISRVLSFWQQSPLLTRDAMPELDASISRLALDFVSLDFAQLNNLLGILGVSYLPMACYRLRLLTFDGEDFRSRIPAASAIEASGRPADRRPSEQSAPPEQSPPATTPPAGRRKR